MIGKKVSHYKILEEIGSGGMGVVYKAEDTNLKRTVALKFVVPRMLNKSEDMQRFIREAQTAASLNHPNICTIYEIEETEDGTFIVMEFIEGQSLKKMIEKGPVNLDKALDIALQLADGLREAQDKRIVHRDIKSSNIMVTPRGQVKVMDFGLAKVIREVRLTETVKIMGTVAYMSPEQASGEAVDHRSDIWSLGVVLYEMFSGDLPFQGEHEQLILYSILNTYHKPITSLREDLPSELERIIDKCLDKEPGERYQSSDELYADLKMLKRETESGIVSPARPSRRRARRKSSRFLLIPGILGLIAAVLLAGYLLFDWFKPRPWWQTSIAVLPIENLNPFDLEENLKEETESLCRSTTRDIIFRLTKYCPVLRVIPFDTMKKYRGSDKDGIEIGKELNVEYVLFSGFIREGQNFRMNNDLIDMASSSKILSLSREFEQEGLFNAQDKISREIIEKLGLPFAQSGYIEAKKREPRNIEAYKWYIRGLDVIDNRDNVSSEPDEWFAEAMRMMGSALNLDSDYALAYWGLGAAHEAYYVAKGDETDIELAIKHFEKAYELNPELAETNLALGWAYFYKEDLDEAIRSFKRAVDLAPDSPLVNCDVGVFLLSVGLYQNAKKYFDRSMEVEPTYLRAYDFCSACYWYLGEDEAGIQLTKKAIEMGGSIAEFNLKLARHLIILGRLDEAEEAIDEVEKILPASPAIDQHRALIFAARQEKRRALELLRGIPKAHPYCTTCIYALLGMRGEAIRSIQKGIEVGFKENQLYLFPYLLLRKNPCYDSLRDDPRFKGIQEEEKEIYYARLFKVRNML